MYSSKSAVSPITHRSMDPTIGETVGVSFDQLVINCIVVDAKAAWGRVRLLVKPVCGRGEIWVEMGRVSNCVDNAAKSLREAR